MRDRKESEGPRSKRPGLRVALSSAAACAALGLFSPAQALDYPTKPVRLVYPYAPGSTGDTLWRTFAAGLSKTWKQTVFIDNKTGAGGIIANEYMQTAPADGYTLLAGGVTSLALGVFSKLSFDPTKDLRLVAVTHNADILLGTTSQLPVKNLAEYVAYAKANPGKLNYASLGKNSVMVYIEWFKMVTGAPLTEIPYKGTAQQIEAMLRNDVHLIFIPARAIKQYIDSGRMTPLVLLAKERLPDMPNVPTSAEAGIPDYMPPQWSGLMASVKVPDDIIQKIRADAIPVIGSSEMAATQFGLGNRPYKGTAKEADEMFDYTGKLLVRLGKELRIKPE